MIVIFNLKGWEKVEDVPEHLVNRRRIELSIEPPLTLRVRPEDKITYTHTLSTRVVFYFTGRYKGGVPIFEYR